MLGAAARRPGGAVDRAFDALVTLAFSLILLSASAPASSGPQFAFKRRTALRPELGGAARYPVCPGAGRSELVAVHLDLDLDDHGDLCLVGVDHGTGPAILRVSAGAADGAAGLVRQPGRGPVLHLLRVHADSAFFPDRSVGRPATSPCRGDVLPVHARRQPVDLAGRDRPGGRALSVFGRETC